jgi:hypothetical protein
MASDEVDPVLVNRAEEIAVVRQRHERTPSVASREPSRATSRSWRLVFGTVPFPLDNRCRSPTSVTLGARNYETLVARTQRWNAATPEKPTRGCEPLTPSLRAMNSGRHHSPVVAQSRMVPRNPPRRSGGRRPQTTSA